MSSPWLCPMYRISSLFLFFKISIKYLIWEIEHIEEKTGLNCASNIGPKLIPGLQYSWHPLHLSLNRKGNSSNPLRLWNNRQSYFSVCQTHRLQRWKPQIESLSPLVHHDAHFQIVCKLTLINICDRKVQRLLELDTLSYQHWKVNSADFPPTVYNFPNMIYFSLRSYFEWQEIYRFLFLFPFIIPTRK